MYRYFLAIRWLLSRKINALGVIGIALGVWAPIVVVAIFQGYLVEVQKHVIGGGSDLSVTRIPETRSFEDLRALIEDDPNVAACAPRIVWYGMLHPFRDSERDEAPSAAHIAGVDSANGVPGADGEFVSLLGIELAAEREVADLANWLDAVEDPALRVPESVTTLSGESPGLIVSRPRALLHGIERGDRVLLTTAIILNAGTDKEAQNLVDAELRVTGGFETSYAGFDGVNVYVPIDALREMLRAEGAAQNDWVNEISIRLKDTSRIEETRARIYRVLSADTPADEPQMRVLTSLEANEDELMSIEHQAALMKLVLFVIMIVAGFLVYATLSMMVMEKTRDIGILTALGASSRGVMMVFLACGLAISIVGAVIGVVTGCLSAIYTDAFNSWLRSTFGVDLFPSAVYNLTHVPSKLDPAWIALVTAVAIGVGVLVAAIPAWRAARHDPLQSLRNE